MKLWLITIVLSLLAETTLLALKDSKSKWLRLLMSVASTVAIIWSANVCYQESVDWQFGIYIVTGLIFAAFSLFFEELGYIYKKVEKRWKKISRVFSIISACIYIGFVIFRDYKASMLAVPISILLTGLLYWISLSELNISRRQKKWSTVSLIFTVFMFSSSISILVLHGNQRAYVILTIGMFLVMLADVLRLSCLYLKDNKKRNVITQQIGTYIGQLLIAVSMVCFIS